MKPAWLAKSEYIFDFEFKLPMEKVSNLTHKLSMNKNPRFSEITIQWNYSDQYDTANITCHIQVSQMIDGAKFYWKNGLFFHLDLKFSVNTSQVMCIAHCCAFISILSILLNLYLMNVN